MKAADLLSTFLFRYVSIKKLAFRALNIYLQLATLCLCKYLYKKMIEHSWNKISKYPRFLFFCKRGAYFDSSLINLHLNLQTIIALLNTS